MRIYFYCFDNDRPVGGIKQIYRHVDALNEIGYRAFVLHDRPGFRASWFENKTRIEYTPSVSLAADDILAAPELVGPAFTQTAKGVRKVIFNQNCYYTFNAYGLDPADMKSPYLSDDLAAVITVSEDSKDYLGFAFPGIPVHRVRYGIDSGLFAPAPEKKKTIAFMPRKNPHAVNQVVNMLKFRRSLRGFRLHPIDGLPEAEVAAALGEAMVFLSFGFPEGFGLPPAEAMACGCVVAGFHGGGGAEFFRPEFSWPVAQEDITGFVRAVEEILSLAGENPAAMAEKGAAAARFIRENYSRERELESIREAWGAITAGGPRGGPAAHVFS
ncbi:MAG: glycosyltransferase [Candidatus Nitrospinota bacterium M3_3B_026]